MEQGIPDKFASLGLTYDDVLLLPNPTRPTQPTVLALPPGEGRPFVDAMEELHGALVDGGVTLSRSRAVGFDHTDRERRAENRPAGTACNSDDDRLEFRDCRINLCADRGDGRSERDQCNHRPRPLLQADHFLCPSPDVTCA